MEGMEQIVQLASNVGVTIVVIAYFMYRDNKFMTELQKMLTTMNDSLNTINQLLIKEKLLTKELPKDSLVD